MDREQIIALQTELQAKGLYDSGIDGIAGPGTQAAMEKAEQAQGAEQQEQAAQQQENATRQAEAQAQAAQA